MNVAQDSWRDLWHAICRVRHAVILAVWENQAYVLGPSSIAVSRLAIRERGRDIEAKTSK